MMVGPGLLMTVEKQHTLARLQIFQALLRSILAEMQDQDWDALRIVLSVARAQSFAAAARHLGVNESTVARRLARAERRMRARLFERTGGKLQPTEAGAELVRRAERIELEVQAAEGAITGADVRAAGTVRITSVPIVTNRILAPALPSLLAAHPLLRIELIAEPRNLSLTKREADIAVRLARPQREMRTIARRVGRLDFAVYGSAEHGDETLPWVTYDETMKDLPQSRWIAESIARDDGPEPHVLVNDAETLLQCVAAGLGKSLLPVAVGDRQPGLARIGELPRALSREIWLLVHPDLRDLTRIRIVMDWITAIAAGLPRFDGGPVSAN